MIPGLTDYKIRKIKELRKQKKYGVIKEIAEKFSLTEPQVKWILSKRFRSAKARKKPAEQYVFPEERVDELIEMWRNDFSFGMMAARTKIKQGAIIKKLKELSLID